MSQNAAPASPKQPARPVTSSLLGIAPELVKDPLGVFSRLGSLGDVVAMPLGIATAYLLNKPEYAQHVFANHKLYGKQIPSYRRMRALVGEGLLVSEGEFWLKQRRIAQPAFHKARIAGFAQCMVQAAAGCADRWTAQAGQVIDVAADMTRMTMQIVCETLLGADAEREGAQAAEAFADLNEATTQRILKMVALPLWVPTAENRRYRQSLRQLDAVIYGLIERRRAAKDQTPDLLSMLLHARDPETGAGMSDRQLRDEVATIMAAGHETTAVALTWTWHLLSQHADVWDRLQDELKTALDGRLPTVEDVDALPYTRMVIEESMRLYPPVYCTTRGLVADDNLDGYHLPARSMIFVSSWVMHRLPALWSDPLRFDPDRFSPDRRVSIPRGAYFPFIAGPRQCIGNTFAMLEAQLTLATLAQRIRLEPAPGRPPVELAPLMSLRPRGGLSMIPRLVTTAA